MLRHCDSHTTNTPDAARVPVLGDELIYVGFMGFMRIRSWSVARKEQRATYHRRVDLCESLLTSILPLDRAEEY